MLHNIGASTMQGVINNDCIWCGAMEHTEAVRRSMHNYGARNRYPAPVFFSPMRYYFNKNSRLCFVQHFLMDGTGLALQLNNGWRTANVNDND